MRKHIQFAVLYIQTFVGKHRKDILISAVVGFLFTLLSMQFYPVYSQISSRKRQTVGLVGKYNEASLPLFIKRQISIGLTSITADNEASASVAQVWEHDPNGTHYTFKIVPGLTWHDGKPFSAKEINYRLEGATFDAPDDTTFVISMKDSYAPLPVIVSQPIFKQGLIGLGIYKVVKVHYTDDIISEMLLQPMETGLPEIQYKFYPTLKEAILGFKLGEVDTLQNISELQDLKSWKNAEIIETNFYDRVVLIMFNLSKALFKEKEVRQAIYYAMPEFDGFEKALSPISPVSWAYSKKIRLYNNDIEAAKKILSKSELASSSADLVLSTYPSLLPTAQKIADNLKEAGINLKIRVENTFPQDYQMFLTIQPIPIDPDQYEYWHSGQDTNLTRYNNPKIDKLLEDGRKKTTVEERDKIYADFQRYLVDDAPAIFLYYPKVYTIRKR